MNLEEINKAVFNFEESTGTRIVRKFNPLSFGNRTESLQIFRMIFCSVDKTCREFILLPEYAEVINWMVNTEGKGLFLMGDCGRGKSTIITGVIPVLYKHFLNKIVKPVQAEEIPENIEQLVHKRYIILDDLGVETKISNYGSPYEGFNKIIGIAESQIKTLFISTNLTDEQLLDRYGERTLDRICRLCKIIKFKGDSLR